MPTTSSACKSQCNCNLRSSVLYGGMLVHTQQTIHLGVGFVFNPQPLLDPAHYLKFQGELAAHGLVFSQTATPPGQLILIRQPKALDVRLQQIGPGMTGLAVMAPAPWGSLEEYLDEARTVYAAYSTTWPADQLQLIGREVTLRQLYDVTDDHALRYLWEGRLKCKEEELSSAFGRPLAGGGLRFVFGPTDPSEDQPITELKVESLLQNPKKLLIEIVMKWDQAMMVTSFEPDSLVQAAERFASNEVVRFLTEDSSA